MKKDNIDALNELHKGACMGCDAIKIIIDKIESKKLKKELKKEYIDYKEIKKKIEKIYQYYKEDLPQKTNIINKVLTWYGVEIETFIDGTDSKYTELLIKGTNMGIIEGRKIKNNKKLHKDVKNIVSEYIDIQEKNLETLKEYL